MSNYAWRKPTCKQCKQPFSANRSDAMFCGANCRKAHQRKRKQVDIDGKRLLGALRAYALHVHDDDVKEIALGWLMQIAHQPALSVTLAAVTDKSTET